MIKEIAVDPELFCKWNHHLALRHAFGVDQARVIAGFPKKWKRLIKDEVERAQQAEEIGAIKGQTIINWLSAHEGTRDMRLVRCGAEFDGTKGWHLNAEDRHANLDAILSHREIDVENAILADDDQDYVQDPRFVATTQTTIQRQTQSIIDCIWPLLKGSTVMKLVEPHFNPREARFRDVLEGILDRLSNEDSKVREVELHIKNPDDRSLRDLEPPKFSAADLKRHLSPLLRSGWQLRIHLWTRGREKLHPRYLLTDRGGIQIDHGWDKGQFDTETTPIHILSTERWQQEMNRYCIGTNDFVIDPETDVIEIK